jgi:poly(3-hydroxybutyrate) depolymerase
MNGLRIAACVLPAAMVTSCVSADDPVETEQALLAPINCSAVTCASADEPTLHGYRMFDDQNFTAFVDGWNRTRKFYVHIPARYDTVDGVTQKIPLIFAFHGGGQTREAMINGKWADYFDQDYAFVFPLGEPDPCDNPAGTGQTQWMQPGLGESTSPLNPSCDPATQVRDVANVARTYWNASLAGSFTDVVFLEQLRASLLARFPKLNADKVYATGFSSGGGMTFTLACYRSALFRGFSVVAKTLGTDSVRGDYDQDGIVETDPLSLVATCGRNQWDAAHAAGIPSPQLWGAGELHFPSPGGGTIVVVTHVTKPVALFVGDQDYTMTEINDTGDFIRARNNLDGSFVVQNPFQNTQAGDQATTQRRTFTTALSSVWGVSAFRRLLVQGVARASATHAIPDADECRNPSDTFSTCDYNYTDQTIIFFQDHADLSLSP